MEVKLREVLKGGLIPVPFGAPIDNGQPKFAVRPISDAFQEATLSCIRDSMEELGLTEDDIFKDEDKAEPSAEQLKTAAAKLTFKDIVSRTKFVNRLNNTKILHAIVWHETGEQAFSTIEEVATLPKEMKKAFVAKIHEQEKASSQLGESKPDA